MPFDNEEMEGKMEIKEDELSKKVSFMIQRELEKRKKELEKNKKRAR